ncbi:MADS-box transcription factor PHERES 1 [Sesamum alatum]|uniref:MADS-box transcription factor PHERES 1 n=1 Tax=Sesamum alatum TaxID=300844 RepID=A0AAE1YMF5_9LAMI|nr:MADS-box transcription factor PHERES 1 [Sesamum alatum]
MTKSRIKHEQISNVTRRNVIFGRRANGLLKKANELSILCGVDIGIVIHIQGRENNAILWPSPEIFGQRLHKFLDFSNLERVKKMVLNEKYLEQMISKDRDYFLKSTKRTKVKESQELLSELQQGKHLNQLDLYQLNFLHSIIVEMLKNLQTRDDEFNNVQQQAQLLPLPPPPLLVPSPTLAMVMQQQIGSDDQFIGNMLEERDYTDVPGVSPNVGDVVHSTSGENDGGIQKLPDGATNYASGVGDGGVQMLPGGTSLRSNNDVAS